MLAASVSHEIKACIYKLAVVYTCLRPAVSLREWKGAGWWCWHRTRSVQLESPWQGCVTLGPVWNLSIEMLLSMSMFWKRVVLMELIFARVCCHSLVCKLTFNVIKSSSGNYWIITRAESWEGVLWTAVVQTVGWSVFGISAELGWVWVLLCGTQGSELSVLSDWSLFLSLPRS